MDNEMRKFEKVEKEREKPSYFSKEEFDWDTFDVDKFLEDAEKVGEIIKKKEDTAENE